MDGGCQTMTVKLHRHHSITSAISEASDLTQFVSRIIIPLSSFVSEVSSMAPRFSEPLFVISVAARLVEMHPQTLRKYEREGLIAPSRTTGNLRLYSDSDIERLRQVKYLVEERGLNLAGVQLALELTRQLQSIRQSATASSPELSKQDLASAFDDVLRKLGFVEESQVRSQRQRRT
jgi:MerR family transcriptional regulator/heat shock protein HspR